MRPLGAFLFVLLVWDARIALAQCTRDTDCRGTRICEDGRCVADDSANDDPPPRRAPARDNQRRPERDNSPAQFCSTNFGSCPMAVAIPRGSSCYCPTPMGPVGGIAR